MMHTSESVAKILERCLKKSGKTQVQLELESGISDTHIARIRAGALPGKWTLAPLANLLGISVKRLTEIVNLERKRRSVRS